MKAKVTSIEAVNKMRGVWRVGVLSLVCVMLSASSVSAQSPSWRVQAPRADGGRWVIHGYGVIFSGADYGRDEVQGGWVLSGGVIGRTRDGGAVVRAQRVRQSAQFVDALDVQGEGPQRPASWSEGGASFRAPLMRLRWRDGRWDVEMDWPMTRVHSMTRD